MQQQNPPNGQQNTAQAVKAALSDKRAAIAICVLYAVFFLLWCLGPLLGINGNNSSLFGMPLWFMLSCVLSYIFICFALYGVIRRFFK